MFSIKKILLFLLSTGIVATSGVYFYKTSSQSHTESATQLSKTETVQNTQNTELTDSAPIFAHDLSPPQTLAETSSALSFSQLLSGENTIGDFEVGGNGSLYYKGGTSLPGTINANALLGQTWQDPGQIGGGVPAAAKFTTLSVSDDLKLTDLSNGYLRVNGVGEVTASRISLSSSADVADRLPTASGGTGNDFSSTTTGSLLSFSSTGQMSTISPGTSGYVLTSSGTSSVPTWSSIGSLSVDWANPGALGSTTPNTGVFTQLISRGSVTPLTIGTSSPFQVDDNGRLSIAYSGDSGYLSSSGGTIFLNNTDNLGTGIGIYSNAGSSAIGNMINVKVDNPNYSQAAFYMDYDGSSNAVEITSNSSDTSSNALAVTGNNINDSTVGVIGYELGKGTIKVSHYRPTGGTDSSASGISIDLKGSGTRAQGLYVDSTETGGTLGNLLRLRNESIDKFVVNYQGNLTTAGDIVQGAYGTDTTYTKYGNTTGDQFFVGTNGAFRVQRSAANSEAFRVQVNGDSQGRWLGTSDGRLKWGSGTATQDVTLRRGAAGILYLEGGIVMNNLNGAYDTVVKGISDSNLFFADATNSRIGIGVSTPLAALHIAKDSGTLPSLLINQTGTGSLFTASSSGTTKFTIANSGDVAASGALSVTGTTTFNGNAYTWPATATGSNYALTTNGSGTLSWTDPNTLFSNAWQVNSGVIAPLTLTNSLALGKITALTSSALDIDKNSSANALVALNQLGSGDIFTASASGTTQFKIGSNGTVTFTGNTTQGANGTDTTFTKTGNVSGDQFFVGTNGAFRVQRSSSASEAFRTQVSGDSQGRFLGTSDGQLKWGSGSATQDITLKRGAANILYLDGGITINNSNGSLNTVIKGVTDSNLFFVDGTNSRIGLGLSTPLAGLHIAKDTGTLPTLLINQTGTGDILTASSSGTVKMVLNNSGAMAIGGTNPGTNKLKVFGDFEVTGACTGCSSDQRLKTNISQLDDGNILDKLLSIRGVNFTWSDPAKATDFPGLQMGVIAQDVEKAFPEIVGTDSRGYKFVYYDKLVAPLIEALRAQQKQIVALQQKVDGLSAVNNISSLFLLVSGQWQSVAEIQFIHAVDFAAPASFQKMALFQDVVRFMKPVEFSRDAAGVATIRQNETDVHVQFSRAYTRAPYITITPLGSTADGYFIKTVDASGFVITLREAAKEDLQFSWIALQTDQEAKVDTQNPNSTPAPHSATSTPTEKNVTSETPVESSVLGIEKTFSSTESATPFIATESATPQPLLPKE